MTSLRFAERLSDLVDGVEVILSDIWGVVHNGLEAFPEACEALHTYRQRGGTVILITNAPRPADSVQRQLRKLGVADEIYDAIVSSGDLTRHFVADHPGKKMFWLGPERDSSIYRGLDAVHGAAGAGRLHRLHRPVRRRNRIGRRLPRDDAAGARAQAAADLRQPRHRRRTRRPADLLRRRDRRTLSRAGRRGDLLRQAAPADL